MNSWDISGSAKSTTTLASKINRNVFFKRNCNFIVSRTFLCPLSKNKSFTCIRYCLWMVSLLYLSSHLLRDFEPDQTSEASVHLSAVWQALETDVQGADHGGLLLDSILHISLTHTHQGDPSLWQHPTEQQVDARVCTAVQTCQQH